VRTILVLAATIAFALATHHRPELAFASQKSMESPSPQSVDPSLFWGDLTPGATAVCSHSSDGAHQHSAPGLSDGELFPTPHDCGGFHGEPLMVAALFDTNLPVELMSWPAFVAKR